MNRHANNTSPESSDVESELQQLREEVRVLRDVIDEIRELIEYATLNGLPERPDAPHGVVKQMPLDPCDPDWRSRVVIVSTAEERQASEVALPEDTSTKNKTQRDGMLF